MDSSLNQQSRSLIVATIGRIILISGIPVCILIILCNLNAEAEIIKFHIRLRFRLIGNCTYDFPPNNNSICYISKAVWILYETYTNKYDHDVIYSCISIERGIEHLQSCTISINVRSFNWHFYISNLFR